MNALPGPCGSPDRGTGAAALPLSGLVDMHFERIAVQAYSGYRPNERPVRFAFRGRQYRIVDIADRWYEGYSAPAHLDYFKVIADAQQHCILRYNSLFSAWSILIADEKAR